MFSLQLVSLDAVAAHKTYKESPLHLRLRKRRNPQPQDRKMGVPRVIPGRHGEEGIPVKTVATRAQNKLDGVVVIMLVEAEIVLEILLAKMNPWRIGLRRRVRFQEDISEDDSGVVD